MNNQRATKSIGFYYFFVFENFFFSRLTETTNIRTMDMTSIWNPQLNENCSYFVFVTFVEIYNNYIYDLFDDDILNK